jgi:DNA-binding IclR family transcriptional regulator
MSGVTVVAAPVWKTRARLSHALVATGISSAVKRAGLAALQDALLSAAHVLSDQLCGEAAPETRL